MYTYLKTRILQLSWQEWCVIVCVLIGGFLRLYNLENALFQGDQGRDALIVSRIFREKDLVFIGPVTSIGNMYLGPLYYYFMLPFLFFSFPSPIGPVYAVALLSTLLIFCVYYFGKQLVGSTAALFAAILMTFSSTIIDFSRYSWNPNVAPFAGFFLLYTTFKAMKQPKYWIWAAVSAAVLLQLHYVTLIACAVAGLFWVWAALQSLKKNHKKQFLMATGGALLVLLISIVPLMLFDAKHGWLNLQAASKILTSSENFGYASSFEKYIQSLGDVDNKVKLLLSDLIFKNKDVIVWNFTLMTTLVSLLLFLLKKKKEKYGKGLAFLLVNIGITSVGLALYKHSIFDHYVLFMLPAAFLFLGWSLAQLWKTQLWGKLWVCVYVGYCVSAQMQHYSFGPAGPTFQQLSITAQAIQKEVEFQEPYALVLLSESHDVLGMNYRYFLSVDADKQPLEPGDQTQPEKLVIINEEKKTTAPQEVPITEITAFPSKYPKTILNIPNGSDVYIFEKSDSK